MEKQTKLGRLLEDLKDYADLRMDLVKLQIVENVSTLFSKGIGFVLMLLLMALGLIMLTVAFTLLLSAWIGSLIWAFVIMGCFFVLVAVIVYQMRDRLFGGSMVAMFNKMFFSTDNKEDQNATK